LLIKLSVTGWVSGNLKLHLKLVQEQGKCVTSLWYIESGMQDLINDSGIC